MTSVKGKEFVAELRGDSGIAAIGNTRTHAIGRLIEAHPEKFSLSLQWGTDEETRGYYWADFNRRNAPSQE